MYEDTKVSQLVINQLSEEKFKELLENDELDPNQLYCTDDKAGYTPPLLSTLWSDHLLNDISWLRADTFSWQSGDVYVSAYNHLVSCMADATEETETIDGIEITYHLAQNKRKICLPDQENKILELYNKTGVAWYYILDEDNTQFKLPRTKYGFTGLRDEVGGYVEAGLPDHTHTLKGLWRYNGGNNNSLGDGGDNSTVAKLQDAIMPASENNPIYGNSDTVQPPATQMYLYFYVGNFERDAVEQTAGVTTEMFNNKADVDLSNMNASQSAKDTIVGWGIPDYSAGIAITTSNLPFTAPAPGLVIICSQNDNTSCTLSINGVELETTASVDARVNFYMKYAVDKGDIISVTGSGVPYGSNSKFFPFKGVN